MPLEGDTNVVPVPSCSANIEIVGYLNEKIDDSDYEDDTSPIEITDSLSESDFNCIPYFNSEEVDKKNSYEDKKDIEGFSDDDDDDESEEMKQLIMYLASKDDPSSIRNGGLSDSVRIQIISDEELKRSNSKNSNEEYVFPCNYSIESAPLPRRDLIHIVKKSDHFPCCRYIDNLCINKEGSMFNVSICKGTSPWKKNCERIHRITLYRDKNHRDSEKYKFSMKSVVDQKGWMTLSFMWSDGEVISVIDNEKIVQRTDDQSNSSYCCFI